MTAIRTPRSGLATGRGAQQKKDHFNNSFFTENRQSLDEDGEGIRVGMMSERLLRRIVFEEMVNALNFINNPELLTETEAAKYLNVEFQTLAAWRHEGEGPEYSQIGASVRYERLMLEAYIEEQRVGTFCQKESNHEY